MELHEREDRQRVVAWSAMEFEIHQVQSNDALEGQRVTAVAASLMFGRAADIVENTRDVAAAVVNGILDDAPYAVCAHHREFPMLPDGFKLGQVDKDPIQDRLCTAVGKNGGTEYALDFALHF
jgi:hypothetical protein